MRSIWADLPLRLEAFNVFNHVQFTGVNAGFTFTCNSTDTSCTDTNIGALTGERGPRVLATELRFAF